MTIEVVIEVGCSGDRRLKLDALVIGGGH